MTFEIHELDGELHIISLKNTSLTTRRIMIYKKYYQIIQVVMKNYVKFNVIGFSLIMMTHTL